MSLAKLLESIDHERDSLISLRHHLHQIPEPGLVLPQTGAVIQEQIEKLGLPYQAGQEITAFTAVLRGGKAIAAGQDPVAGGPTERPTVLLRADMDGLPVQEDTGLPWQSSNGHMHACGHDVHMSGLIGAMRALAAQAQDLPGDVVFMFQPGEESHNGARKMIAENMLKVSGKLPDYAYGLHVWAARYPAGFIGTRPGPMMASSDTMRIFIRGRGGHGSAPHEAKDPIPVACQIVTQLQVMVAREFNVFDPVVVTCGEIHAGTAPNVIPEEAMLHLTIRTFSDRNHARILRRIEELATTIAQAHEQTATVHLNDVKYPVTWNYPEHVEFAQSVVEQVLPGRWALQATPMAAGEDFAVVLQQIPGCFIGVSAVEPGEDETQLAFNHSPHARYSDRVVTDCAKVLASLAYQRLTQVP